MINVYYNFGDFQVNFIYQEMPMMLIGMAEGAWVTDRSGKLLAEARMTRLLGGENKQLQGIEIEEFHYRDNGKLIFYCKSEIVLPTAFKEKETGQIGKKAKEYFFIWPMMGF